MEDSQVSDLDNFRDVGGVLVKAEGLDMEQFAEEKARDFS